MYYDQVVTCDRQVPQQHRSMFENSFKWIWLCKEECTNHAQYKGTKWTVLGGKGFILRDTEKEV